MVDYIIQENNKIPWQSLPEVPQNIFVLYAETFNAFDLVWDNPAIDYRNLKYNVLGVNIYRSNTSDFGEYEKINSTPISTTFYRDATNLVTVTEDVSAKFISKGTNPNRDWVFKVDNFPIVNDELNPTYTPFDVEVYVDGNISAVEKIDPYRGEINLFTGQIMNKVTRKVIPPVLPTDTSVVTCKYKYLRSLVTANPLLRYFYRLTTVSEEGESPLAWANPVNVSSVEAKDYIWKEAMRRNRWMLYEGGERGKVFIRKWYGKKCGECFSPNYQRGKLDCKVCYGTGIEGGYVGPYEFLFSPFDTEKRITRTETGLNFEKTSTHWSSFYPYLNSWDILFTKKGERYMIGSVKFTEERGLVLQQEFEISLIPPTHPLYKLPMVKLESDITDKVTIPEGQQVKGRTVTFENISY